MGAGAAELHEQLSWFWEQQLRPGLNGLTDDELRHRTAAGTVAARLGQISDLLAQRASFHFGDRSLTDDRLPTASSAATVLTRLDSAWAEWDAGVVGVDERRLHRAHQGPPGTADERYPLWAIVLYVNREVVHLGGQVLVLLALQRASGPG